MAHRRRKLALAAVTLLGASVLTVGASTNAFAATPTCTSTTKRVVGTVTFILPSTAGGSLTCTLQIPASGPGVTVLQQALNACYAAGIAADGSYGKITEGTIIAIQESARILADGIYGPQTRAIMRWPTSAPSNPCRRYG